MTSHASRKTKHLPPRLWNSVLTLTLPTAALHQPGPFPSPGPENSSTHKMRATREKSHSQLGGPTSGWLWRNLRVWDPKSAHPTWQNLPGRRTFFAQEHRLNVVKKYLLNVLSRGNCIPKGVTSPHIGLLDSNTPPPKASPLLSCLPRKERPAHWKHGATLEHGGFVVSFLKVFHLPTSLFQSCVPDLIPWHGGSCPSTPCSLFIWNQDARETGGVSPSGT